MVLHVCLCFRCPVLEPTGALKLVPPKDEDVLEDVGLDTALTCFPGNSLKKWVRIPGVDQLPTFKTEERIGIDKTI